MISAGQVRAARALLGLDQRALADWSGASLPTNRRMKAGGGVIRGNANLLMTVVGTLSPAGAELVAKGVANHAGGGGVRLTGKSRDGYRCGLASGQVRP
jgi:hypothetical protein